MFDEESRSLSQSSPSPIDDGASMLPEPESQGAPSNLASQSRGSPSSTDSFSCGISQSNDSETPDANAAQQIEEEEDEEINTTAQSAATPASQLPQAGKTVIREASIMRRKEFSCGFCSEQDFIVRCTRRNDLRRHMEDTHHSDSLWICVHRDCRKAFQWLGVYKIHAGTSHPTSRLRIEQCEVIELCPQTVFACGFDKCEKLFEARSALEAPQTKKKYIDHILNHFRNMKAPKEWTYTTRIRNLLRQTDLVGVWPPAELLEEELANLEWDPQITGVVQKQLETRHLGDRDFLIRNIIALGLGPSHEVQLAQARIALPILGECSEPMHHKTAAIAPVPNTTPILAATPKPAAAPVPNTPPMMASGSAGNGPSLVNPSYADIPMANGGYQQQSLIYQGPMQHMINPVMLQIQQQQYHPVWSDPMQWVNFDGEGNRRLM
ncbi:hypothetical protein V8C42DRAFT_363484 [Trichoderma barbatum]